MALPLLLLAIAGLALVGRFWEELVSWLSGTVANFIGDTFGHVMKNAFLEVVQLADRAAVAAKNAVKQIFVKADVFFTQYGSVVRKQSVSYLRNPQNPMTASRRTVTEDLSFDDLPPELRKKLQMEKQVQGTLTMRQIA